MDNTWAFEDDGKIVPEFLEAHRYYLHKYPDSESAKVVGEYLSVLENLGWKKSVKVESFIKTVEN